MTFVYGVTTYGAKLQILKQLKDIPELPEKYHHEGATYLMKKTFLSIREMFTATKQIQVIFLFCFYYNHLYICISKYVELTDSLLCTCT